jgi:hypothetical protein
MADGGKGSRPRPFSVNQKTFDANWDAIFNKKDEKEEEPSEKRITDHSGEDQ